MAGDWIKMRTDLYRDPKVCLIADALLRPDGQLASYVNQHCQRDMTVTRNVTRNVTVGALVTVWGVTRTRGRQIGDDILIPGATLKVIDDISDIPGFGLAMESVGWVVQTPEGIIFPRFIGEFNVAPTDDSKAKAAERQRRYREKSNAKRDALRDVTVTSQSDIEKRREEKSREYNTIPPSPPLGESAEVDPENRSRNKRRPLARSVGPANAAIAGIEIDGSLVMYDDDPMRWEAAFVAWWNERDGVCKRNLNTLDTPSRSMLMDRLSEPDWHWKQTAAMFPLWTPSRDWVPTLSWFLEPATVSKILDGRYEQRKAAARQEQTIPDVFTFTEEELG